MIEEDNSLRVRLLQLSPPPSIFHSGKGKVLATGLWITYFTVAVLLLCMTPDEHPNTPIRLWICVYATQCLVNVILLWCSAEVGIAISNLAFIGWWIFGCYWVISGGEILRQNALCLYWLSVVYLVLPVFWTILYCVFLPGLHFCVYTIAEICWSEKGPATSTLIGRYLLHDEP